MFANRVDLVIKHAKYLVMVQWDELDHSVDITPAISCNINRGIMDEVGNPINLLACIYVDDAIMLATSVHHMKMVLVAMIEAIFVVMGEPDEQVRQCPLALDKWR